jgi:GTPase SAR1 family protein
MEHLALLDGVGKSTIITSLIKEEYVENVRRFVWFGQSLLLRVMIRLNDVLD